MKIPQQCGTQSSLKNDMLPIKNKGETYLEFLKEVQLIVKIGKGSFGSVEQVYHKKKMEYYAIK